MTLRNTLLGCAAALGLASAPAAAQESFKIGVITFLSGQAAESFGVPAWNALLHGDELAASVERALAAARPERAEVRA